MGDSDSAKTVAMGTAGVLGFLVGSVLGQVVYGLAVGLPMLIAVLVSAELDGDPTLALVVAAAFGAALVYFIAYAFGLKTQLGWWFVAGAGWIPAGMLLRGLGLVGEATDSTTIMFLGAYVLAGVAMAVGFTVGRRRRPVNAVPQPT